ncbi:MAG: ABC transporter ATP-binding protein, partial [Chloroflexi bacterium]|nr:ABC transporter ATP-binding protein [Chloroflexota bacterium]
MWGHGFDLAAANKGSFDWKLLSRTFGYMRPYKAAVALSVLSVIVVAVTDLMRPYLTQVVIDRDIPSGDSAQMIGTLLLYLGLVVLHSGVMAGQRYV